MYIVPFLKSSLSRTLKWKGLKVQEVNVFIQKVVKDVPEQETQPKKLPENNNVAEEK